MTILHRRDTGRVRIDVARFADELAKRLPAVDDITGHLPGTDEVAEGGRGRLDHASELAREITRDLTRHGADLHLDARLDDVAQRLRAATAGRPTLADLVARLERELPTTDRDRYDRAYLRGRVQARSTYIAVGVAIGVATGLVAAILLDPKNGKERRERIGQKASGLTSSLSKQAADGAKAAQERARAIAVQRGLVKPDAVSAGAGDGAVDEAAATIPTAEAAEAQAVAEAVATVVATGPAADDTPGTETATTGD